RQRHPSAHRTLEAGSRKPGAGSRRLSTGSRQLEAGRAPGTQIVGGVRAEGLSAFAHEIANGALGVGAGPAGRTLCQVRVDLLPPRRQRFTVYVRRQTLVEVRAAADAVSHVSLPSPVVPPSPRGALAGADRAPAGPAKSSTSPSRSGRSAHPRFRRTPVPPP